VRPVFRYPKSGGRDPSPKVAMVSINLKQRKEKAMHRSSLKEDSANYFAMPVL
jgi:hypothetical protein